MTTTQASAIGWFRKNGGRPRLFIVSIMAVILGCMMLGLLVREHMPVAQQKQWCVLNVQFTKYTRLLLVCDTTEFLNLAYDPRRMMQPGVDRQSRPLLVVGAWALSWAFQPVGMIVEHFVPKAPQSTTYRDDVVAFAMQNMVPAYLGYVTINIAILLGALLMVVRAVPDGGLRTPPAIWVLIATLTVFLSNDVVKAFVWTPHTQMLNILVPIWGMNMMLRPMSRRQTYYAAIVAGIGMLMYANFIIAFAALAMAPFVRGLALSEWPIRPRELLANTLISLALFVAPTLAWMLVLKLVTGGIHVSEVDRYGEVVWLFAAARAGLVALVGAIAAKTIFFAWHAMLMALPAGVVLTYTLYRVRGAASADQDGAILSGWRQALFMPSIAATVVGLLCLGLLVVLGWQAQRLSLMIFAPFGFLVCLAVANAAAHARRIWTRADQWMFLGAAFALMVYVVAKDGPWS